MSSSELCKFDDKAKNATFQDDMFNLSCYTEKLTRLVRNTRNPYVIALSAEWGNGKTFFLNAWRNAILPNAQKEKIEEEAIDIVNNEIEREKNNSEFINKKSCSCCAWLKRTFFTAQQEAINIVNNEIEREKNNSEKFVLCENQIPCVYVDIWALEDMDDPLLAVCYEIQEQLSVYYNKENNKILEYAANLVNMKNILKVGFAVVEDKLDKYQKTAEAISSVFSSSLDRIENKTNSSDKLYDIIRKIVDEVKEKTQSNSILIMIDELDRCNPKYIIKLLERIKNLFNIPGLVFVLAIDNKILQSAIKNEFGFNDELQEVYLDKFIDYFYYLPTPNYEQYICALFDKEFAQDNEINLLYCENSYIKFSTEEIISFNSNEFLFNNKRILNQREIDNKLTYFDTHHQSYNLFQQWLIYIFCEAVTSEKNKEKYSLRKIKKIIEKFFTICRSNKLNLVEVLYLMCYLVRKAFILSDFKTSAQDNCFYELWYNILAEAEKKSKEDKQRRNFFEVSKRPNDFITMFYENLINILSNFFNGRTKEDIEEKIKKAVVFYEETVINEDIESE